MKYTYNMDDLLVKFEADKEAMKVDMAASIEVKGISISVEFSCDELTAVGQSMLAMKNASIEACQKIIPIIKESIIEIGKAGSTEIEKHRILDDQLCEKRQVRSKSDHETWKEKEEIQHKNLMERIQAERS